MTEHEFQQRILLSLGARTGLRVWRQNSGSVPVKDDNGRVLRVFNAGPPKGAADISGVVSPEGWRLEIEVKSKTGKRTQGQERWAGFIERAGGVYVLVQDSGGDPREEVAEAVRAVYHAIARRRAR